MTDDPDRPISSLDKLYFWIKDSRYSGLIVGGACITFFLFVALVGHLMQPWAPIVGVLSATLVWGIAAFKMKTRLERYLGENAEAAVLFIIIVGAFSFAEMFRPWLR